jgi:hypothetical protein
LVPRRVSIDELFAPHVVALSQDKL